MAISKEKQLEEFHKELNAVFEKYDAGIAFYVERLNDDTDEYEAWTTIAGNPYIGEYKLEAGGIDHNTPYKITKTKY